MGVICLYFLLNAIRQNIVTNKLLVNLDLILYKKLATQVIPSWRIRKIGKEIYVERVLCVEIRIYRMVKYKEHQCWSIYN